MASSSRGATTQVDSFIDDDDLTCPLCVEEFDLSDRNFKPCPCGYQVCQFCYNNIKNNMNGLCPACRRPYDEKSIEWKVVTQEEVAQFKANIQKNAKKKAEQRQKEAQKREVESLNRKHLAGLRVVQKNLVYVVGLSPNSREEDLLQTLRGDKYFGQYGKIIKIVVSKAKEGSGGHPPSIGVYVTFAKKEDASRCINAVNGSVNGDRTLRAQYGTTKYCSAYLRGENCSNKQCMFLHEAGEDENSYTRQDLSSMNSVHTQRPLPVAASTRGTTQPVPQAPVAAAAQPMAREGSKDESSDGGDGPALPSTANWATRPAQHSSRRGSHATSGPADSPSVINAVPAPAEPETEPSTTAIDKTSIETPAAPPKPAMDPHLKKLIQALIDISFEYSATGSADEQRIVQEFPPLWDDQGGAKRRAFREQQEEERLQESQSEFRSMLENTEEEEPESGSLQLGGEPENDVSREGPAQSLGFYEQRRSGTQPPIQRSTNASPFGNNTNRNFGQNIGNLSTLNGRNLTPVQQQQLMILKSGQPQSNFLDQFPPGIGSGLGQASSQNNLLQQGQNRQASRYNFGNENVSAPASGKPGSKIMSQQASMMPQQGNQFYGSSLPGPPPGLKSTGTPPISAGGMFGQGHGFANNSLAGASNFGGALKENGSDLLREMLRSRGGVGAAGGGHGHDAGKREYNFPTLLNQYPSSSTPAPSSGLLASLYGPQPGAFQDFGPKQKKKGKKHRHANTSSSGGGGLVDLADPSILQARMHQQQQQSNASVGQGLFGGQAPDGDDELLLDEAALSVDALVADSTEEPRSYEHLYARFSRPSTPSVPPGLALPHGHPSPLAHIALTHAHPQAISRPSSVLQEERSIKQSPLSISATISQTPSRKSSTATAPNPRLGNGSVPPTPVLPLANPKSVELARRETSVTTASSGPTLPTTPEIPSASKVSRPSTSGGPTPLADLDEFPALGKPKTAAAVAAAVKSTVKVRKDEVVTPSKSAKAVPVTLNIATTTETTEPASKPQSAISTPVKSAVSTAFPPLPSTTPSTAQPAGTPRPAPKTLRLVPATKVELPTASTVSSPATSTSHPPSEKPRQPSVATAIPRPGSPISEIISDNASMGSASLSRANSPPPAKVGSHPVRVLTKNQQKKQRREAMKEKERMEAEAAAATEKVEPEPEIGPILGRKKKQKKEKTVTSKSSIKPATSPASPAAAQDEVKDTKAEVIAEVASKEKANKKAISIEKRASPQLVTEDSTQSSAPSPMEEPKDSEKQIPTPMSILQDLVAAKVIPEPSQLALFQQSFTSNYRPENFTQTWFDGAKLKITDQDRDDLLNDKCVHKITAQGGRLLLTPNGDVVRNLTEAEETQFLSLQKSLSQYPGPGAFLPLRYDGGEGYIFVSGRAIPDGPPSYWPSTKEPGDAIVKIQREEAMAQINQHIIPRLTKPEQFEKFLNPLRQNPGEGDNWTTVNAADYDIIHTAMATHGIFAGDIEGIDADVAVTEESPQSPGLGVTPLSVEEAERAMVGAKKETEKLEKTLNQLLRKNRRLVLGSGH